MKVSLFVTCLVDQLYPNIGVSSVKLLRSLGCEVEFRSQQTCCGQPAFNTGYTKQAKKFAALFIDLFDDGESRPIVVPSGSCTAMIKHFPALFVDDESMRARAKEVADRTYELTSFIVNVLGVESVPGGCEGKIGWHDACHGLRELGLRDEPRRLIRNLDGAEFVELDHADVCCGFGGTFSVKYPEISTAMLDSKVDSIVRSGVSTVAACDASCLMQISGRLSRLGHKVETKHIAEVLAPR
jgi:L-lactate dehydrogenase complex protein LldE